MAESIPPATPEEIRRLNRDLMEKMIDKAASDPEWKQRLLDAPEAAIQEAGFPEAERLRDIQASVQAEEEAEVVGQGTPPFIPQSACYPPSMVCDASVFIGNTWA